MFFTVKAYLHFFSTTILCLLYVQNTVAQISIQDSSVYVVAYWKKGESKTYTVTNQEVSMRNADTVKKNLYTYDITITVKDSTEHSYILECSYSNLQIISGDNLVNSKQPRIIETDTCGKFKSIINWEDLRDENQQRLQETLDNVSSTNHITPELKNSLQELIRLNQSKEFIEQEAIPELLQLVSFHGRKYTRNSTQNFSKQTCNMFTYSKPIDTKVQIVLQEFTDTNTVAVLWAQEVVNQEQLQDAVYEGHVVNSKMRNSEPLSKRYFKDYKIVTNTVTNVLHDGWVQQSVQIKTMKIFEITTIDSRTIVLQ